MHANQRPLPIPYDICVCVPSMGLLRECKSSLNLREPWFEALEQRKRPLCIQTDCCVEIQSGECFSDSSTPLLAPLLVTIPQNQSSQMYGLLWTLCV